MVPKLFRRENLNAFRNEYNLCQHEVHTFNEIVEASNANDLEKLKWFTLFGDRMYQILLNVHAYRKGLEFGFELIDFDRYGWLRKPVFLDQEELKLGIVEMDRYGTYSTITLGHGPNGMWAYGMSINYGTAGSSCGICVHDERFSSRESALNEALMKLKNKMELHAGDSDTVNYNQKIILATLKSIKAFKIKQVQLSLFA
ncbi:hypothetical protein [Pedobacter paludis]|uniref:Uncharacterized protein n=1 Tax=Pedobacter paludis TaxID=2203212 RepID=A0A317F5Q7_9SPHI|nr:hypothetical protein [Pedobacter paludis]PWS33387.1 hypothetical protein DF947_01805 [Pedobacter paludis]